jgi:hypothetical protein
LNAEKEVTVAPGPNLEYVSTFVHRSVPLCAGQSGQDGSNGCQIKF